MEIELKLSRDFEDCFEEMEKKYGEDFLYINGLHPSQLDFSEFIDNFVDKETMADATIDPNANASHKDIRSFMTEKGKSEDKLFALNKIFMEIKKKWGLKTAREWFEQEFSRGFYLNDASSASYYPYCWANDFTRLATEGLFFLDKYNNQPPKHLTTYFDDAIEFISFLGNRQSGAVGMPNVLIWAWWFWYRDVKNGYYLKDPDTYLRQCFQKFVYRLNQPFLRIDQCAFTNVSIFDRKYLESLFGGVEFPDGELAIDHIEDLIKTQEVFMDVVSEIREQNMFTFPVLTYSCYYKNGKFQDEKFARWASKHNMQWSDSNFFVSDNIGVLSNCPLRGDTLVKYRRDSDHPWVCSSIESLFKMISEEGASAVEVPAPTGVVRCRVNMFDKSADYCITLVNGLSYVTTADHLNKVFGKSYVKTVDLSLDDKLQVIHDDNQSEWVKIDSITRTNPTSAAYCMEVLDKDVPEEFILANGIVTHNCRLLSDTSKITAFCNSIGGTALSVGSCRVSTINLVRIAYESGLNKDKYIQILKDRVLLDCKALTSMRHILQRNIEKGLLPNYQEGAVELDKQFCTIGGIGMYEVMDLFGLIKTDEFGNKSYSDEAVAFASQILDTMNEVKDNFKCDFSFNIEMIPAENCAGVICRADNLLYEQNKYFIYSNQWIPLTEKCTIQEKCRLGHLFDAKCGGGCIAHINIENRFPSEEAAWDMLNYVASQGVMYFAFNTKISVCKHRHAFIGTKTCPICGEPVADQYSRVVGFYTPVSSYQKIRKQEFSKRQWYNVAAKDSTLS